VIDTYSVKPIDAEALRSAIDDTGHLVVVEDHRVEGGLGDAVLDGLAATGPFAGRVTKLAVRDMPGSGTPDELRAWAGIDADAIVEAVRAGSGGVTVR
jgi:transketolase